MNSRRSSISKTDLFENIPVIRSILTLSLPIILASVVSVVYNLVDTYFVGLLNDPIQNAAVSLAAPAMVVFYSVTNLCGVGSSSLMSRKLGEKEFETVKKASATGLYLCLLLSALLSAVTLIFNTPILHILGTSNETFEATRNYLFWTVGVGAVPGIMNIMFGYVMRAEGQSVTASIGMISGCILNVILDPFFILPEYLGMNAAGAGLATFISNCVSCIYYIAVLLIQRGNTFVSLSPKNISLEKNIIKEIVFVGAPGVPQNLLNVIGMALLNNIAAGFGTVTVAAIGISSKINQFPIQVIFGFSQGVMPLIGYTYAAGKYSRMKEAIKKAAFMMVASLIAVLILYCFAGQPLIRFFMNNDLIVETGAVFLIGYGLSFPFMCIDFLFIGISQSFGIGKYAFVFCLIRKGVLEIPFILLFSHLFGLYGLAFAQAAAEVIMCMLALILLRRLLKDKE